MASNKAEVSSQDAFQDDASSLHLTAFFNPIKQQREQALKKIRASAGHSPEQWQQLDAAAGIAGSDDGREEIEADSPLGYHAGIEHSDQLLNDQYVGSTIVDMLVGAGFSVSSSLASYVYTTQLQSGNMEAQVDMNPRARARQDRMKNGLDGVPIPVVHADYELDGREMEVARAHGEDPEASHAREARRAINRREAEMLFEGWGGEFNLDDLGAFTVGGLNTDDASKIIQDSGSAGWTGSPQVVLDDIKRLHDDVEGQDADTDSANLPLVSEVGAYVLVPRAKWGAVTRQDYESSATDEPLVDRLQRQYPYLSFVPAPRLASDTAIMLLNDPRYFQMVNAQGMTNTAWDIDGGYARRHKLVSSRIPFVRIQPDGIRGIVRLTGI